MSDHWTKHAIVVRKRTIEEIRDLTLLVIGKEFKNVAFYSFALILPIFFVDVLLFLAFWGLSANHFAPIEPDEPENLAFFLFFAYVLIRQQAAFAGSATTQFLGFWLFRGGEKIEKREVFSAWIRRFPQLLHFLVLTRPLRLRSYYAETILLEQTPFFKAKNRISTGKRVAAINRGEIFGETLTTRFYWFSGVVSGYFILNSAGAAVVSETKIWFPALNLLVFPFFVFSAQIFLNVFNFLRYVNFRVEREGWDVDLAFKAERAKLSPDADFWKTETGEQIDRRALRTLSFDREFFDAAPRPSANPANSAETPPTAAQPSETEASR